jgi:hypothetical protein
MALPEAILTVVAPFRPLCTAPRRKLMILLTGTLRAHGRRTVCAALRLSGEAENGHWSSFHQVLNRARWSPLAASQCLLEPSWRSPSTRHWNGGGGHRSPGEVMTVTVCDPAANRP